MLKKIGVLAFASITAGCSGAAPTPSAMNASLPPAGGPTRTSALPTPGAIEVAPVPSPAVHSMAQEVLARRLPASEELRRGAILEGGIPAAPRPVRSSAPADDAVAAALIAEIELALGVRPSSAEVEGVLHAEALREQDMGELRGGYAGLAFSVFFNGSFHNNGAETGFLDVSTNGSSPAPSGAFSSGDGEVRISASIGEFGGASGIFQIAQVPGNFNVVNNNLFVQIALINLVEGSQMPSLQSLFGVR